MSDEPMVPQTDPTYELFEKWFAEYDNAKPYVPFPRYGMCHMRAAFTAGRQNHSPAAPIPDEYQFTKQEWFQNWLRDYTAKVTADWKSQSSAAVKPDAPDGFAEWWDEIGSGVWETQAVERLERITKSLLRDAYKAGRDEAKAK